MAPKAKPKVGVDMIMPLTEEELQFCWRSLVEEGRVSMTKLQGLVKSLCGYSMTAVQCKDLLRYMDANGDGRVGMEDFKNFMQVPCCAQTDPKSFMWTPNANYRKENFIEGAHDDDDLGISSMRTNMAASDFFAEHEAELAKEAEKREQEQQVAAAATASATAAEGAGESAAEGAATAAAGSEGAGNAGGNATTTAESRPTTAAAGDATPRARAETSPRRAERRRTGAVPSEPTTPSARRARTRTRATLDKALKDAAATMAAEDSRSKAPPAKSTSSVTIEVKKPPAKLDSKGLHKINAAIEKYEADMWAKCLKFEAEFKRELFQQFAQGENDYLTSQEYHKLLSRWMPICQWASPGPLRAADSLASLEFVLGQELEAKKAKEKQASKTGGGGGGGQAKSDKEKEAETAKGDGAPAANSPYDMRLTFRSWLDILEGKHIPGSDSATASAG
eukprot:TRINITY_DN26570_c0_g1_i2.p1 TRINITY_DN26570_c0_g1~~TRINITY_DN26570_c0_g1_i2.p1  ORF type:complete len:450 (-),score=146.26 TRINITY_DN26570_c0_g1_i2:71-1420(-)